MKEGSARLVTVVTSPILSAAASQIISSLSNFLFLLFLVGSLTADKFGLYSISFAIMLGCTAIMQGYFQIQMVTTLPELAEDRRYEFASTLFFIQLAVALLLGISVTVLAGFLFGWADLSQLSAATALATLGLSGKEFLIRYLFAISSTSLSILMMNLLGAGTLAVLVLSDLPTWGPQHAMLAYGLAQVIAMVLGLFIVGPAFRPRHLRATLHSIGANGAWGAFSAVTYSIRSSAHTFIVGATLPLAQVGHMNAARTLLTPVTLMIPTMSAVMLPRLSQAMVGGGKMALGAVATRMSLVMSTAVIIYAGLLALFWPLLMRFLLGDDFLGLGTYVALWSVFALVIALRNVTEWTLQAMQSFRSLSIYNLLAAGVTLVAVTSLTLVWGVIGAISGLVVGEVFLIAIAARVCSPFRSSRSQVDI